MALTKASSVLTLNGHTILMEFGNPPKEEAVLEFINFDVDDPPDDRGRARVFYFNVEDWLAMDSPVEITITIEPGDTLNV